MLIYMSQLLYERGWVTRNSLIPLPLASVSSNGGWQSLPPGTLVLLAGPIGLMGTQTTKFEKKKKKQRLDCMKAPIESNQ